jgi:hypothetical protein
MAGFIGLSYRFKKGEVICGDKRRFIHYLKRFESVMDNSCNK